MPLTKVSYSMIQGACANTCPQCTFVREGSMSLTKVTT